MSLESRLAAPPARGTQTELDNWYNTRTETEQAAIRAAVTNPEWQHVQLQAIFEDEGAPRRGRTSFGDWRRRRAAEWA